MLIIPRKHFSRMMDVPASESKIFSDIHRAAQVIVEQEKLTGGFRLVTNNGVDAGQTVDHLHYHLLAGRPLTWPPG